MATSKAVSKKKEAKPAGTSRSLWIIPLLSIALGVFCHVKAIRNGRDSIPFLSNLSPAQRRAYLGLGPGYEQYDWAISPFLLVVALFKDMMRDQVGKGLLILLFSFIAPLMINISLEAGKPGRHALLCGATLVFVTTLGQAVLIGAATTTVWVPLYAWVRANEASQSSNIYPLPSPSPRYIAVASLCSTLAAATVLATSLVPTTSEWWFLANVSFQFFPLAFLPLAFYVAPRMAVPATAPRLLPARLYLLTSYLCILLYWYSLSLCLPPLHRAYSGTHHLNDGETLLLWDGLGLLIASYAVVLIDSAADDAAVRRGGKRVHHFRSVVEDVLIGWPGALLLGPGWGMSRYWQRREVLAEKARWGVVDKDE